MNIKHLLLFCLPIFAISLQGGLISSKPQDPIESVAGLRATLGDDILNFFIVAHRTQDALDLISTEEALLDYGRYDNKTPLHYAAHQANLAVASKVTLLRPDFVNAPDKAKETPLYIATIEAILLYKDVKFSLSRAYQKLVTLFLHHGGKTDTISHNPTMVQMFGRITLQQIIDECGIPEIQDLFKGEESVALD